MFLPRCWVDRWRASRGVLTHAGSVTMMDRPPKPICRRRGSAEAFTAESDVRNVLRSTEPAEEALTSGV
jgi:hypothetical protein